MKHLFNDYLKRVSFYCNLNIIEIKESKNQSIDIQKKQETLRIINAIPKNSRVFLCSLNGREYTSNEFANIINQDNLSFIIGGSNGLDEETFKNKIKFSSLTFPHQLFRVILLEQIYRAFTIKTSKKYHK